MYTTIIQVRTIRYHQIAEELRGRILSGSYAAGRLLPSESDLSAEFEVSRVTIRKALDYCATVVLLIHDKVSDGLLPAKQCDNH